MDPESSRDGEAACQNSKGPGVSSATKNRTATLIFWAVFLPVLAWSGWAIWGLIGSIPSAEPATQCKMNARMVQQAVRHYQEMENLKPGDRLSITQLTGAGLLTDVPSCPKGHGYEISNKVPEPGVLYLKCSAPEHLPANHEGW